MEEKSDICFLRKVIKHEMWNLHRFEFNIRDN